MYNMKNLFRKVRNKEVKKDTREWYTAEMLTEDGKPYRTATRAINEYEAIGLIISRSPEKNRFVRITKGEL